MTAVAQTPAPAAVLLTGLSGAGKTTLGRGLVQRLAELGVGNAVLIDGEELRERLSRKYGHSLAERDLVWREIVEVARKEMKAGRVVVIASIAHRVSMRVDARIRLQRFFEAHVDCPVETCATRDPKGHYRRAFASEYDCFIGVTHPYEHSGAPELRIDTSQLSLDEALALLTDKVLTFLQQSGGSEQRQSMMLRMVRRLEDYLIDSITDSPVHWKTPEQRRQDLLTRATSSKAIVKMERASSAQLMVLYGGMDAFLGTKGKFSGMSPIDFLRRSGLFGRNLAWVRDPYGDNFMRGVGGELDTADKLTSWTVDLARSLPQVREVHGIGYSSGSYGALMFGHLCRMNTVYAFSPRTSRIEQAAQDRAALKDLLLRHNGVTRYHIWYSSGNKRDRAFAEFLADCPGVTLHPCREGGSRHSLIRFLAENGALRSILPPFLPADRKPRPIATQEQPVEPEMA